MQIKKKILSTFSRHLKRDNHYGFLRTLNPMTNNSSMNALNAEVTFQICVSYFCFRSEHGDVLQI